MPTEGNKPSRAGARHFAEFQERIGKPVVVLSDVDSRAVLEYLLEISNPLEQADFLATFTALPDDGVTDSVISNPVLHNRNHATVVSPLSAHRETILQAYFDPERVIAEADALGSDEQRVRFLLEVRREFQRYRPTTLRGVYSSWELGFFKSLEAELEHRKELLRLADRADRPSAPPMISLGDVTPGDGNNIRPAGATGPSTHDHDMTFDVRDARRARRTIGSRRASNVSETIDFAIITIREDEFAAVLHRFPSEGEIRGQRTYSYSLVPLSPEEHYRVVVVRAIEQGGEAAQDVTRDIIEDLKPRWILLVGIAGARPAFEFTLGDVVLGTRLADFSVSAALAGGRTEYAARGGPMSKEVQDAVVSLPIRQSRLGHWNSPAAISVPQPPVDLADDRFYGDAETVAAVRAALEHHFGSGATSRPPKFTTATIASSDRLIKDPEVLAQWTQSARDLQAVEMELQGVYTAAHRIDGTYPVLAIRGISDVIGFRRSHYWTTYACHTAAAFAWAFLQSRPIDPSNADPGAPMSGGDPAHERQDPAVDADADSSSESSCQETRTVGRRVLASALQSSDSQATYQAGQRMFSTQSSANRIELHFHDASLRTTPDEVPAPVGAFRGRDAEIGRLAEELSAAAAKATVGVCAIRGLAGVGKTQVAFALAHRLKAQYQDGQVFIELAGMTDAPLSPERALREAVSRLGQEAAHSDDRQRLEASYRSLLSGKRMLILADDSLNVAQVEGLRPVPGCALVVTSRDRLALPDVTVARIIDLGPLARADAAALLLDICPRIGDMADRIAALCGDLPLALDIAASLLVNDQTLGVDDYVARLENERTRLASLANPDLPESSVEAALSVSYERLDETARAALRQASVFAGSFTLTGAEAALVAFDASGPAIEDLVRALHRRSLVEYEPTTRRYALHDLVRVFARERLVEEELHHAAARHAQYYSAILKNAGELYAEGRDNVLMGLRLFDLEWANIEAAWAYCSGRFGEGDDSYARACIDFSEGAMNVLSLRLDSQEILAWLGVIIDAAQRVGDKVAEGTAWGNLGVSLGESGNFRGAVEALERALKIAREVGDRDMEVISLGMLGNTYAGFGEHKRAIASYKEYLAAARDLGNHDWEASALGNLGIAYRNLGDLHTALDYQRQSLRIVRDIGDRHGEGTLLSNMGNVHTQLGDACEAIGCHKRHLAIARELGDLRGQGNALADLGFLFKEFGKPRVAIRYYERAVKIARQVSDRRSEGYASYNLGLAYRDIGRLTEATLCVRVAAEVFAEFEDPHAGQARDLLAELDDALR